MKKDSPSLLLRVSRTFKFHFWDNLMAASHLGLRGLLRLCSGRRRRRPAAKPWWNGRYLPTMEMLELRLQPATLPTFYPTGVNTSGMVLDPGNTDPHYAIVARPSPLTDTTSRTVTPATGWLANSSISRWITPTSSGYQGVNIGGYYTYRTTLDFTGYDPDSIVLSGYWAVDDFAVITVNGSGTPSAAVYYPGWSSWHTFTLNSSNSSFVNGSNDIDFIVGNYYGSTGLRVGVVTVQANALPVITDLDVDPINEGQTATLNGSFTDEESGQSHTVDIDWGDGSSPTTVYLSAGTTTFSPTHVYADGGDPYTTYTITVDVTDSDGAAAIPDTIWIDVDNVDPTATNDTLSIYSGTTKAKIRVLANDSDPANTGSVHDPLTITSVSTPAQGTATWNDNGTSSDPMDDWIDYEPSSPSYTGTDSFTYNIDDGDGGTSTATVTVTYEALPVIANTPAVSNADPMQGTMKSFGAASFSLYNGNVRVGVPLRIDTSVADSALVYNSQSVQPRPIIQIKQPTLTVNGVPAQIQTQLTWWPDPSSYPSGGVQQGWVTVGTGGHSAGDTYLLAAQVATPVSPTTSGTNYYNWRFDINITLANGTVLMRSVPGKTEVVVNDNSPFGAGWSIAGLDRLVPVTGGVLYVYGAGGAQFFDALGGGAYASLNSENRGTLVKHGDDTFTYWTPLQDRYDFDTGGLLMQISDANGTTSFTYESSSTRVSTITTPAGGVATFVYSGGGTPALTQIQLPGGHNLGATINVSGDLTVATYQDNSLRSFTYDGSHRLTNDRTGAGGWNVTYTYDTGSTNSGALTSIDMGGGVIKTVAAAMPRGLATSPGVNASAGVGIYGDPVTYTFDSRGRVIQEVANDGGTQTWTRNTDGQPATYTDALGHTTSYSYNGDGDLLTVTAADGGVTTYTYAGSNIFHQPIQVADPLGHLTSYVLDSAGRVTVMIDALNQRTSTLYDGSGHVTGMQDANGNLTQYLVDGQGRATVTIDALSNRTSYLFDAVGNLTQSTDARGGVTTLLYDAMNRLTSSTAPGLLTTTYEYNVVGGLTRQTDALGRQTSYSYTDQGWLQATTQAAGSGLDATTTYLYDSHGNMTGTLDPLARLSGYVYDLDNRQTVTVDALGNRTTLTLDLAGNVTRRTDARGNPTDYLYDVLNRQTVTIDALGNRATVLYDLAGNMTGQQDGLGRLTTYVYDLANRQTLTIDALGGQTKMFYDKVGNVTEVRDARNNPTTYAYDALNRQTVMFDALGGQTKTFYDKVGNVTEVRDARNNPTTFTYDALNRQTLTVDALGNQTKTFYDKVGNVTEVLDARNNPTTFAYDALNRQTLTVDALGHQTKTFYDAASNVTEVLDARNKATTFTYDALNRQTVMFDALGGQTKTFYDQVGNVTEVLDARNNATTFTYDVLNRQTVMFDALGGQTKTFYDKVGNVTEVLDARNNPTTFTYDALNRQTVMFDALGGQTKTFYDQVGNVTEVRDARNNPTTFAYDVLNRQTLTVDALGNQTKTFYDQVGNVTEVLDARNNPTTFAYDVLNRQTLTVDALGGQTKTFYDQVGNVTEVRDARNNPTSFAYDVLNRQTLTVDALGGQTKTFYDAVGNVTEMRDARNNATTFTYDALNRQTVMFDALGNQTKTFYDAVGNVTEVLDARNNATTFTYDALNRQTVMFDALGGQTKTFYDAVGNVTEVLDARNNATTFAYDVLNRQTVMFDALGGQTRTFYDAVGNVTEVLDARNNPTTFTYDALNRQTVMFDALGGQTKTFYDKLGNVTGVLDANGHGTSYVYDAANRQTVSIDALGKATTLTLDAVGNATVVTDASGHVSSYLYDALNRQTVMIDALGHRTSMFYDAVGNQTGVMDGNRRLTRYLFDGNNRQYVTIDPLNGRTTTLFDGAGNVTAVIGSPAGWQQLSLSAAPSSPLAANSGPYTGPWDVANGDFNSDGKIDLVTTHGSNGVRLFLGNGDGTFSAGGTYSNGDLPGYVAVGDLNGDDKLDIVLANLGYGVSVLLGNGDGTFASAATYANSDTAWSQVVLADFNGDGYLDVAATESPDFSDTRYLAIFLNNGDGTLATPIKYSADECYWLAAGDVNNDGHVDLVVERYGYNYVRYFAGNGDGTFQTATNIDLSTPAARVTLADFNGDGNLDVAVSTFTNNVIVRLGNGDGSFEAAVTLGLGGPWPLLGVQLLGAGNVWLVLVEGSMSGTLNLLPPEGDGTFGPPSALNTRSGWWSGLTRGDFNGDGAADVAMSNFEAGTVDVYLGTLSGTHDNLTTFAYDAVNRKISETQQLGGSTQVTTFAYDSIGLLTSTTDALGRRRDFQYDAVNRLTTETWYQPGGTIVYDTRTASYDAVGNQLTTTNLAGTVTMLYDALNRMTVQKDTAGQVLTYTYDAVDNATVVQDSQGGVTTSVYDNNNQLTSRRFTGTSVSLREDFTYTNTGLPGTAVRYNDVAGLATQVVSSTTYLYDVTDKVTSIYNYKADGSPLASFTYSYDAANQLTRAVNKGVERNYTYSAAGQLKADGTATYNYDAAGNRAGGDFVSTSGNQMVSDGAFTYTYDAVGNLTHKEGLSGGGYIGEEWDYGYDNLNRMISADRYLDTAHTMHAEYKYDWNGNRTQTHVTTYAGVTVTADTTTTMAYDGADVWGEFQGGSLTTRYLRGDGVDQLLAQVSGGGTANWLLTDHLGSVRDVTDNSHMVGTVGTLVYDGWGNATPSGTVGRYQWTGREKDVETGLQYNRARYYDPMQGRWTSQDPLGFDAGDSNLYRYVNNQPTMATDPSGLQQGSGPFGLNDIKGADQWELYLAFLKAKGWPMNDDTAAKFKPTLDRAQQIEATLGKASSNTDRLPGVPGSSSDPKYDLGSRPPTPSPVLPLPGGSSDPKNDLGYRPPPPLLTPEDIENQRAELQRLHPGQQPKQMPVPLPELPPPSIGGITAEELARNRERQSERELFWFTLSGAWLPQGRGGGRTGALQPRRSGPPRPPRQTPPPPPAAKKSNSGGGMMAGGNNSTTGQTQNRPQQQTTPVPVRRPAVNTGLPARVIQELPAGQIRTPDEVAQARNFFERNRAAAEKWWSERNGGRQWPSNATHAEHPRALADGGDPLFIEPGFNGPNAPHMIPGQDGLNDFQRWGARGGRPPNNPDN